VRMTTEERCHCGKRHRKGTPEWAPWAAEQYRDGSTVLAIAQKLGLAKSAVWQWLVHEGVRTRSRGEANRKRRTEEGHRPHQVDPAPCACGECGELTSGRLTYRRGEPVAPRYVAGHHLHTAAHEKVRRRPKGPRIDRSDLRSAPFIAKVTKILKARGWTFRRFAQKLNVSSCEPVLNRDVPQAKYVLRVTELFRLDPLEMLKLAGHSEPSVVGRVILEWMAAGETQVQIAAFLGVSQRAVCRWSRYPEEFPGLKTVELIAPRLGLSDADTETLLDLAREREKDRRQRISRTLGEGIESGRIPTPHVDNTLAWTEQRPKMMKAIRTVHEKHRFPIPRDELKAKLEEGLNDSQIARLYGCLPTTVRDRAIKYGLRAGATVPERRKRKRRTQLATHTRVSDADARRRQAAEELPALLRERIPSGDEVAKLYGIRKADALGLLKAARTTARS
jgi:transcriptional regulator with XRE-family HTH domain